MQTIKAIYDGNNFKLEEPAPVAGKYEVVITFMKPILENQKKILDYFNIWDQEDTNNILDIFNERDSFSFGRNEV